MDSRSLKCGQPFPQVWTAVPSSVDSCSLKEFKYFLRRLYEKCNKNVPDLGTKEFLISQLTEKKTREVKASEPIQFFGVFLLFQGRRVNPS